MFMKDTKHFIDAIQERGIKRKWVDITILQPDKIKDYDDGTRHYIKQIEEFNNRWLRVIVNMTSIPKKRITAFFDRGLRRKHEN